MKEDLVLETPFDDLINDKPSADKAEDTIRVEPENIHLRAHLVHYYYNREVRSSKREISEPRFRHICWFLERYPDLKFCGTAPFYLMDTDPHFDQIKGLWENSIQASKEVMRRVNACMFVYNASPQEGLKWFDTLCSENTDSLWVLALHDLFRSSRSCFNSVLDGETKAATSSEKEEVGKWRIEIRRVKDWDQQAVRMADNAWNPDFRDAVQEIQTAQSLNSIAKVSGYTFFRIQSNSILGFDPAIVSIRFQIHCWILKHVPWSNLGASPIFTDPFQIPRQYELYRREQKEILLGLHQHIENLWIAQLQKYPEDLTVASNAAQFCVGNEECFPTASKNIKAELMKSKIGRNALRKQQ